MRLSRSPISAARPVTAITPYFWVNCVPIFARLPWGVKAHAHILEGDGNKQQRPGDWDMVSSQGKEKKRVGRERERGIVLSLTTLQLPVPPHRGSSTRVGLRFSLFSKPLGGHPSFWAVAGCIIHSLPSSKGKKGGKKRSGDFLLRLMCCKPSGGEGN